MSTNNFLLKNADHYYAICMGNYEDQLDFEMDFDGTIYNLMEELKSAGVKTYDCEIKPRNGNRNFPEKYILTAEQEFPFMGFLYEIQVHIIARGGYYQGAILDWELDLSCDVASCEDSVESLMDEHDYYFEDIEREKLGLYRMNRKKLRDRLEKEVDTLIDKVESAFEKVSINLVKVGQFSNGEAVYREVNDEE